MKSYTKIRRPFRKDENQGVESPSLPAPLTPPLNGLNLDFTKGEEERISS